MPIFALLGSLFGGIGSVVKGFLGLKEAQVDVVKTGIATLGDALASDAEKQKAAAAIIAAEASAGGLAANWRPVMMLIFLGMIVSYWFGYTPANLLNPVMPPMIERLFDLITLGIAGYIPCRTLEKIVTQVNVASVLKTFFKK